jgi:hypothetical protein
LQEVSTKLLDSGEVKNALCRHTMQSGTAHKANYKTLISGRDVVKQDEGQVLQHGKFLS